MNSLIPFFSAATNVSLSAGRLMIEKVVTENDHILRIGQDNGSKDAHLPNMKQLHVTVILMRFKISEECL